MDIYSNLFGLCSNPKTEAGRNFFDLQSLINKLLLFETFILYSPNLREIPYLVQAFGFEGALAVLSSGALKISCEVRLTGQVGQSDFLAPGGKSLPLGNYSISYGYAADRKEWISDQLKNIGTLDLSKKQIKKLKQAVVKALDNNYLQDFDSKLVQQTNNDLASNRGIELATVFALEKEKQIKANPNDFSIKLHQTDEHYFQVETNLGKVFSLDEVEVHKIVEKAVLGIARLNQRITEMKVHNALSGFLEDETPLFEHKLEFILRACDPNRLEEDLNRVFILKKVPVIGFGDSQTVDIERLLEIRNSIELREFRAWLRKTDTASDSEIIDQLNDLRSKLGVFVQSDVGKILRLSVGFIPGLGTLAGIGLGIVDTFLLEKMLPYPEVVAFVDKLYPSIFEKRR